MKVIAILGSPRNGDGLKIIKGIEARLKSLGNKGAYLSIAKTTQV